MKKRIIFLLLGVMLFSSFRVMAQWWNTAGNNDLIADGILGSNVAGDGLNIRFRTQNLDHGMLTFDGRWGFGIIPPNANSKVHINSAAGQNGLRVDINGVRKFLVSDLGGVSVGSNAVPPAGGLYVFDRTGIGTNAPAVKLHVVGGINANLAGGGYIVAGPQAGVNLVIDNDEIMARNNGAVSPLYLNKLGGNVNIGTAAGAPARLQVGNVLGSALGIGTIETLADGGNNTISANSHFIPTTACDWDLGSAALPWDDLFLCNAPTVMSDERLKENIQSLSYGLNEILKLRAVTYDLIKNHGNKKKIGLIAQEVQKVLPEIVVDYDLQINEKTGSAEKVPASYLGVKYTDVIPVLVKAMQEQQQQIDELKQIVEKLSHGQPVTTANTVSESIKTNVALSSATLEQNKPNPLTNITSIRYNLPAGVKNAQLMITDNSGKTIKQITLNTGKGVVNIDASALGSGTYQYSLMIDGKRIETKTMVVAH